MVQKRETKTVNKLCVRVILSLSFVCGAYFFEFCGRNLACFVIAYNYFNGKYAPEAGKTRMCTAFFTRAVYSSPECKERQDHLNPRGTGRKSDKRYPESQHAIMMACQLLASFAT